MKNLSAGAIPIVIALFLIFSTSTLAYSIEELTGDLVESFLVGDNPVDVVVDEIAKRSYVVNKGGNSVTVIDTGPLTIVNTISVGTSPSTADLNRHSATLYVTNSGSDTVSVIDTVTNSVVQSITVGDNPNGVAVNDFIEKAYVVNTNDNSVSVINTFSNDVVATVTSVGINPTQVAVHKPLDRAFVASPGDNKIYIVDRALSGFTETYSVNANTIDVGGVPSHLVVDQEHNKLFVSVNVSGSTDQVKVYDISSIPATLDATINVGSDPRDMGYDIFTHSLYVANFGSNSLSVIDTNNNTLTSTLTANLGTGPLGVFIDQFFGEIHVTISAQDKHQVLVGDFPEFNEPTFTATLSQNFFDAFTVGTTSNPITLTITDTSGSARNLDIFVDGYEAEIDVLFDSVIDPDGEIFNFPIAGFATETIDIQLSSSSFVTPGTKFLFVGIEDSVNFEGIGFPLDAPIIPSSDFGFASVFLSQSIGFPGDTVTLFANGFTDGACTAFFGGLSTTTTPSCNISSGSGTFNFTVPSLSSGIYPVNITDSVSDGAFADFFIPGGTEKFTVFAASDFIPPFHQNTADSSALPDGTFTVTVDVFSGQTLTDNPVLTLYGLPFGMQAKFDSGQFSESPSTIISGLGTGGSKKTVIAFKVDDYAAPGPIDLFLEVKSGNEVQGIQLFTGIMPSDDFYTFGDGLAGFNPYDVGTLVVSPQFVSTGDTVNISASGFGASLTPTLTLFTYDINGVETATNIPLQTGLTFSSAGTLSTTVQTPSSLSPGTYFIELEDTGGRFAETTITVITASDVFTATAPFFVPPIRQGENSESISIQVQPISGKDAGQVTITVFGLPRGALGSFDKGTPSASPTTVLNVGTAGTSSTQLVFQVDANTPPGPIYVDLELTSDNGGQTFFLPIDTGIMPSDEFFVFGETLGADNIYNVAQVILNPLSGAGDDSVTISAFGFSPNTDITIVFAGKTIPIPTGTKFDEFGSFTTTIKVPTNDDLSAAIPTGLNFIDIRDSTGITGFADFLFIGANDLFTFSLSPKFPEPIQQPTSGTATSSDIKLTAEVLPGRPQTTVDFIVEHVPQGLTIEFDNAAATINGQGQPFKQISGILGGSKQSTTMTISIDSTTPPGHYFIPIRVEDTSAKSVYFDGVDIGVMPSSDAGGFGRLSLSPDAGKQGTPITMTGFGFQASAPVSLFIAGEQLPLPTGEVFDSTGYWSVTINVPDDVPPGFYPITLSDGTRKDTQTFNVLGNNETYELIVTPQFLSPVEAGQTSESFLIQVNSLSGSDAPVLNISVEGFDRGVLNPQWSTDQGSTFNDFTSTTFVDNPLVLNAGQGTSATALVRVQTQDNAPSATYPLLISALEDSCSTNCEDKVIPMTFSVFSKTGSTEFAVLSVFPDDVRPGERVTLLGNGFVSGTTFSSIFVEVPGQITPFEVTLPKTVTVSAGGSWNTELEIPTSAPPGFYFIFVEAGTGADFRFANAPISVIPSGQDYFYLDFPVDIIDVPQGGSAFISCPVEVECDSDGCDVSLQYSVSQLPIGLTTILRGLDGVTIVEIRGSPTGNQIVSGSPIFTPTPGKTEIVDAVFIPDIDMPVGTYEIFMEIEAVGESGNGEPIQITVLPSGGGSFIISSPSSGTASDATIKNTFAHSGEGFNANTPITITFDGLSDGTLNFDVVDAPITTNANGDFTATLQIPSLSAGIYTILATDGTTTEDTQFKILPSDASFGMQISPRHAIANVGGSTTITTTIIPYDFNSQITLSQSGLPSGVTATFSPATFTPVKGVSTSIDVTLTVDSGVAEADYLFTISASGIVSESAVLQVVDAGGDVALFVGPADVVIEKGSTATADIKIAAIGTASNVAITLSTLPTGITADKTNFIISPDANTGFATDTVTFTSDAGTTGVGIFPVTFTATVNGKTDTSNISIVVFTSSPIAPISDVPTFDPSSLSSKTPLQLTLDFTGTFDPQISINSISTLGGTTTLITNKIDESPESLGNFTSGVTSLGTEVVSIEPQDQVSDADWEFCIPIPDGADPSTTSIAFLDDDSVWQVVPSTIKNGLVCATLDHFTTLGPVSVPSSGGGGGGGSSPPSFTVGFSENEFPITINEFSYTVDQIQNVTTSINQVGKLVKIELMMSENQGPQNIEHVALYLNHHGERILNDMTETAVIYDKYKGIEILDPYNLIDSAKVTPSQNGNKAIYTFEIVFANEMAKSGILINVWDLDRNSLDIYIPDALEIVQDSGLFIKTETQQEESESTAEKSNYELNESVDISPWIKTSAGWWSEGQTTDYDFALGIEHMFQVGVFNGPLTGSIDQTPNNIPHWLKYIAGWWSEDQISDKEFLQSILWLIENEVIMI